MQVSHRIDQLIQTLQSIKPTLSNDLNENKQTFKETLNASLSSLSDVKLVSEFNVLKNFNSNSKIIPEWVDPNYGYDPNNPRKPNMRELMQGIAKKSVEDIYAESKSGYEEQSVRSSEILYGVLGTSSDARNWNEIMSSNNVLETARAETGKMLNPNVDIETDYDEHNNLIRQYPVLKDAAGKVLRELSGSEENIHETLKNFGATSNSIPSDLESKIIVSKFDYKSLEILQNYSVNNNFTAQHVQKNNPSLVSVLGSVIEKDISNSIIPIQEMEKL